jgi:hypothetical protein
MLRDDVIAFAERATAVGNDVTFDLYSGMPHGFPVLPLSAADSVVERVGTFTSARLSRLEAGARACSSTPTCPIRTRMCRVCPKVQWRLRNWPAPTSSRSRTPATTTAARPSRSPRPDRRRPVCGSALYKAAIAAGVSRERVCPMVSGVEFTCRDVTLKSLPARHESTMTVEGEFVADQPQSFLATTAAGSRIFCGGDTSLSVDLQMWGDLYRPDVAIALAVRMLGASTVIPVHYHPHDPAPAQLIAELTAAGDTVDVAVLAIGDTWRSTA